MGSGRGGERAECKQELILCKHYAEYIMRNAGLEEAQAGIKIALCIIGSRFIHLIRSDSNAFLFMAK